jgi:Ca2+-binding EF-hand superfamily protein
MSWLRKCFGKDECSDDEFLEKKWKRFFAMIDGDDDGKVSKKDHEEMGKRFADGAVCDKEHKEAIRKYFNEIWGKVYDPDNKKKELNFDEFHAIYKAMGSATMTVIAKDVAGFIFKACDADQDGFFTLDDFQNFLKRFTSDRKVPWAAAAFKLAASPKDQKLSLEGFEKGFVEFLTGTDRKSIYLGFWGSLD